MSLRPAAWIVALSCAATSAADPPSAVECNEQGLARLAARRPADAIRSFEEALALRPGSAVLERNLAAALALASEGKPAGEALPLLERATRVHPTRIHYRFLLGRARLGLGDEVQRAAARGDFAYVLSKDFDHLEALLGLAEIAYFDRDLGTAIEGWRHALALRPDDNEVPLRLAKAEREIRVEGSFAEVRGAFFRVRHSPAISPAQAQAVLVLCEEVRGRLAALYGSYPPPIVVTLYTPAEFRSATGLHGWVAGVSDGTIRLALPEGGDPVSLTGTICHETTHQVIRGIAPNAPVWLHEGLAQIEEGRSAADAEARLRRAGPLPDSLLSADVLRENDPRVVAIFYDTALAFARYLDSGQHGSLRRLLREMGAGKEEAAAFREIFGDTRAAIFDRWRSGLG